MSEVNPFAEEVRELKEQIAQNRSRRTPISRSLSWHSKFDPEDARRRILDMEELLARLEVDTDADDLRTKKAEIEGLERALSSMAPGFNLKKRFGSAYRQARSVATVQLLESRSEFEVLRSVAAQREAQAEEVNKELMKRKSEIDDYEKFDRQTVFARRRKLDQEVKILREELAAWEEKALALDALQSPLLDRLTSLLEERERESGRIELAARLDRELDQATSPRDRALLHERARQELGTDSPRHILRTRQRRVESIDRNVEKLRERLREKVRIVERDVRHVVIDGNNLCYREDGVFVGDRAVRALCAALSEQGKIVTVFFDGGYERLAKKSLKDIREGYPQGVEVNVLPRGQRADEFVLGAALNDDSVVVSNDLFSDYPDQPAVSEARIMRYVLWGGRIIVPDLLVNGFVAQPGEIL